MRKAWDLASWDPCLCSPQSSWSPGVPWGDRVLPNFSKPFANGLRHSPRTWPAMSLGWASVEASPWEGSVGDWSWVTPSGLLHLQGFFPGGLTFQSLPTGTCSFRLGPGLLSRGHRDSGDQEKLKKSLKIRVPKAWLPGPPTLEIRDVLPKVLWAPLGLERPGWKMEYLSGWTGIGPASSKQVSSKYT